MPARLAAFVGRSGSGKTTFLVRLIPLFATRGLRVGSIKQTHHQVILDQPGKDSFRHRQAGAERAVILKDDELALFAARPRDWGLAEIAANLFPDFDWVLAEGFKKDPVPKVEIHRLATGQAPLYLDPSFQIQALVSDQPPTIDIPHFGLDQVEEVSEWMLRLP